MRKRLDLALLLGKFLLVVMAIESLIIIPAFKQLTGWLLQSRGIVSLSSGDIAKFLFSLQSLGLIILTFFLLTLFVCFDIHAMILLARSYYLEETLPRIRDLLWETCKTLPKLFNWRGVVLALFIGVVVPLSGIGLTMSLTENIIIPRFIFEVIEQRILFFALYLSVIIFFNVLIIRYIFSFHFLLIAQMPLKNATKSAKKLLVNNLKNFLLNFFSRLLISTLIVLFGLTTVSVVVFLGIDHWHLSRFGKLFLLLHIAEIILLVANLFLPWVCFFVTKLYCRYQGLALAKNYQPKQRLAPVISVIILAVIIFNLGVAFISDQLFNDLFYTNYNIQLIAHRGAGNLGAENGLESLSLLRKHHVTATEVDIQRTKDGEYALNHDITLKRVFNVSKTVQDLTLGELQKLGVTSLDDLLKESAGIHLYLELKGKTADKQMADDVVAKLKERNMLKQATIISLDYELINYVETTYPEIETGYLFFFSLGKIEDLNCDCLLMETGMLSDSLIDRIHNKGKKVFVWTVNQAHDMSTVIKKPIDGVITDQVQLLQQEFQKRDMRDETQLIIDALLDT